MTTSITAEPIKDKIKATGLNEAFFLRNSRVATTTDHATTVTKNQPLTDGKVINIVT